MAIDILMSTYNGEKYLENQLLSLLMQRYKDWTLYIRDDGSTDNTVAIINKFVQLDSRIKLVEKGENLGYGKSFMQLLPYSTADYVAFCDQDDIWFEDKLLNTLKQAQQLDDNDSPLLICCQGHTYSDKYGVITNSTIPRYQAKDLRSFLFVNGGYEGCLFLCNRKLIDMAKDYGASYFSHDNILCLIAHTFGRVKFLMTPLILYRHHDNNTSGSKTVGIVRLIKFVDRQATVITKAAYNQQKAFFEFFYNDLTSEQIDIFNAYLAFPQLSKWARLKLIINNKFKLAQYPCVLLIKTLLRRPM